MIGPINFEMKQAGKPSAGNPHAGFDVAGAGDRLTVRLVRHSQRKRGAMDRPDLRGDWRQSSTLLMSGGGKRGGASASVLAPVLDSTTPAGVRGAGSHAQCHLNRRRGTYLIDSAGEGVSHAAVQSAPAAPRASGATLPAMLGRANASNAENVTS